MPDLDKAAGVIALTPLELDALRSCAANGGTRCNDGGLSDTMLSILCNKPSLDDPLVRWQINPSSREDGYISLYTVTDKGRAMIQAQEKQG